MRRFSACAALGAFAITLSCGCAGGGALPYSPAKPSVQAQLEQASRLLSSGDREAALRLLTMLQPTIPEQSPVRLRATAAWLLGRAYVQTGQLQAAAAPLSMAAGLARVAPLADLQADTLNDLGLLHDAMHDEDLALAAYARALAAAADRPLMSARIRINVADLYLRHHDDDQAAAMLNESVSALGPLPAGEESLSLQVAAASRLGTLHETDPTATAPIQNMLEAAVRGAGTLTSPRLSSEAWGELGHFKEARLDLQAARAATDQAIFAAQQAQSPDLLYRWEWQAARLRRGQGDVSGALAYYARAIAAVQPIRRDLQEDLRGRGMSYRDAVGPLFFEFADLLLRDSTTRPDDAAQAELLGARDSIEDMKAVELEDYFHDDCIERFRARGAVDRHVETHTAILYPILLADRVELLLAVGDRLQRFTVAIPGRAVSDEALRFRKLLVRDGTQQYLDSAQRLYRWLIDPINPALSEARVDTLVVVPDGALLGIPFAALNDGHGFLVERYALAVAPALTLIDGPPAQHAGGRALAAGLSAASQGYPALPGVESELRALRDTYRTQVLSDSHFTADSLQAAVEGETFDVVHIASHGVFGHDASDSFLLTYDGRLGMDGLERVVKAGRFRRDPVELLTLSACETASGDDRAALGLAGVAIKAGARSVVATLWRINDEASAELIGDFYQELKAGGANKARALQRAQLRMLGNDAFGHPAYWAPYLLIGNWD